MFAPPRQSPATRPARVVGLLPGWLDTAKQAWPSSQFGFCRSKIALIGRTQLSRQTAEMKFVALLLLPIAASSGSSASAFYDGPQDQVQVTQAVGQQTGARSLRGRQKRRPCAKSIATYCSTSKNAAAKQACLRAKLGGGLLDPRCEALVERRADARRRHLLL